MRPVVWLWPMYLVPLFAAYALLSFAHWRNSEMRCRRKHGLCLACATIYAQATTNVRSAARRFRRERLLKERARETPPVRYILSRVTDSVPDRGVPNGRGGVC